MVQTDIPESMLGVFVDLAAKAKEFTPVNVQFTPPDIDQDFPDYDKGHQMVQDAVLATTPVPEEEEG